MWCAMHYALLIARLEGPDLKTLYTYIPVLCNNGYWKWWWKVVWVVHVTTYSIVFLIMIASEPNCVVSGRLGGYDLTSIFSGPIRIALGFRGIKVSRDSVTIILVWNLLLFVFLSLLRLGTSHNMIWWTWWSIRLGLSGMVEGHIDYWRPTIHNPTEFNHTAMLTVALHSQ